MFTLRFDCSQLSLFAKNYEYDKDVAALAAGKRIASGDYSRANLVTIFEWKTKGRGKSRIHKNADGDISDALALAVAAKTDRSAIAVLLGLRGVAVPVASAVLTMIDPNRYSIIDFRALWSLSVDPPYPNTVDYYLLYLDFCRSAAESANMSLRDFDRALWQYSKKNQTTANL